MRLIVAVLSLILFKSDIKFNVTRNKNRRDVFLIRTESEMMGSSANSEILALSIELHVCTGAGPEN